MRPLGPLGTPRVGAGELSVEGRGAGLQGTADGGVRVAVLRSRLSSVPPTHPSPPPLKLPSSWWRAPLSPSSCSRATSSNPQGITRTCSYPRRMRRKCRWSKCEPKGWGGWGFGLWQRGGGARAVGWVGGARRLWGGCGGAEWVGLGSRGGTGSKHRWVGSGRGREARSGRGELRR